MSKRTFFGGFAAGLGTAVLAAALFAGSVATAGAGFWRHGHRGHWGEIDEEKARFGVTWMLRDTGASDDQVDALVDIAMSTHGDMVSMRGQHREGFEALAEILAADEVDPAALESLRAEHMVLYDEASEIIVEAMAEAARVLTPEQRAELIRRHRERHARWHDHPRDEAADATQ